MFLWPQSAILLIHLAVFWGALWLAYLCWFGGEIPAVLPDEPLSVRIVHEQQKSASWAPFRKEIRRYERLFVDELNPDERRRLRLVQLLRAVGFYWAQDTLRKIALALHHRLIRPMLAKGGDALEHVPARIRPPIRRRDRIARSKRP
jgi:hypothetical protein